MPRVYIGLATTFHDPALAIVGPDGDVRFAEATERFLQYKRAPNCEADPAAHVAVLLDRYVEPDADIVLATSWGGDFTDRLKRRAARGLFDLDALSGLEQELNRSLVPDIAEHGLMASLHHQQQRAGAQRVADHRTPAGPHACRAAPV